MKLIDRETARRRGRTQYFTGQPCKYGHVCERYVSTGGCLQCHRVRCNAAAKAARETTPSARRAVFDALVARHIREQPRPARRDGDRPISWHIYRRQLAEERRRNVVERLLD